MSLTPKIVLEASHALSKQVVRTPVLTSALANEQTGAQIYFKCENLQTIGAFKFRGACYAISKLTEAEKARGVIAFSSGNHAQAIAKASQINGIPSLVVMPKDAPASKIKATKSYGAEVILYDRHKEDRELITQKLCEERGMVLIPPYNHEDVIAGQGTAAVELFEDRGELDALFVCVGGGGLIAGSALAAQALSPRCLVIGVEPELGDDGARSFRSGKLVKIDVPQTLADGAQTQVLGAIPFEIIKAYVHDFVSVSDLEICKQMKFFMEKMKLVVEPTGCLSAAAAMKRDLIDRFNLRDKKVGVIISGGNVDPERFAECLSKGDSA